MYTRVDDLGQPVGLPVSFPPDDDQVWLPMVMPPPRVNDLQVIHWEVSGGACRGSWIGSADPLDRIVTSEEVNQRQLELELAPIDVFGVVIQCDDRSEKFMRDALDTWDVRGIEPGVFEDVGLPGAEVRVIYWKSASNELTPVTKEQLQALYTQMRINRAVRAQKIWARAQQFKNALPTYRTLITDESWLT
jgi:Domain of unknown function (DUF4376)